MANDKVFTDEDMKREEESLYKLSAEDLKVKREREAGLLQAFKKSPSKTTFMPLYTSYKPFIINAAKRNMFGSPIPPAAHIMYAAQSFLDAIRTHDPAKGGFNTHAFNTISEKGKRLNLKYQNIGYIPESRATKYQAFQTAQHLLREHLGREPSTLELADEMAMPPNEIERMRKEMRQDLLMVEHLPNIGPAIAQSDKAMQFARDLQYSLIPKHRVVLEHAIGLNGVKPLLKPSGAPDIKAIAKTAKLTVPEIRSAIKTINRKFKEHRGTIGTTETDEEYVPEEAIPEGEETFE